MRVRFRPEVQVVVAQEVVHEGDSFEVLCRSQAYPQVQCQEGEMGDEVCRKLAIGGSSVGRSWRDW